MCRDRSTGGVSGVLLGPTSPIRISNTPIIVFRSEVTLFPRPEISSETPTATVNTQTDDGQCVRPPGSIDEDGWMTSEFSRCIAECD